jgi:hypothetical protein
MLDMPKLLALVDAMNREGVEYITFGAVALVAHGLMRVTEDADFFIAPTVENVDRLKRALRSVWNDPHIDEITADDLLGDYPAVRYGPPDDDFTMDFLTRLGEVFHFDNLESETVEMNGISIRVVTPRMLYRMKKDTVRHKDRVDADALRRKFNLTED